MDKIYYTITEICSMLKTKKHTVKYWEKEFTSLKSKTQRGIPRRYTLKDFELLKKIKALVLDRGFTLKGAKEEIRKTRKDLIIDLDQLTQNNVDIEQETKNELDELVKESLVVKGKKGLDPSLTLEDKLQIVENHINKLTNDLNEIRKILKKEV